MGRGCDAQVDTANGVATVVEGCETLGRIRIERRQRIRAIVGRPGSRVWGIAGGTNVGVGVVLGHKLAPRCPGCWDEEQHGCPAEGVHPG